MKRQTNKTYSIYFPESLITSLDSILENNYNDLTSREDFLKLFYIIEIFKTMSTEREVSSFSIHFLRNEFGRKIHNGVQTWLLPSLIKICVENNILEFTNYSNYDENRKTRTYKYTSIFEESILDNEINFILENVSASTFKSIQKYSKVPTDYNLLSQYNLIKDRVEIDEIAAATWAHNAYKSGEITFNTYENTRRNIATLMGKENIFVSDDKKSGRVYTIFNMVKKELREFCTLDGESLINIDLKCAQPYFLASLLKESYPNNKAVNNFYNLVTKEDIYVWMSDKLSVNDRQKGKEEFFHYFFKPNRGNCPGQSIMKKELNEVYELIKLEKSSNDLHFRLQRLESDIFISVENQFVKKGCLSVHDSLYFKKELKEEIISALNIEFEKKNFKNYRLV